MGCRFINMSNMKISTSKELKFGWPITLYLETLPYNFENETSEQLSQILEKIDAAGHIVLIAHRNPDADSLGSASAMYTHLLRLHKKVTLFCMTEKVNPRLAFLPWFDKMRHRFPDNADLAISFDCGSLARLGVQPDCELINFDHHAGNDRYGTLNCVVTEAISTTQVLYDYFCRHEIKINAKMATALYAGLLDDSHAFMSPKTDRRAFEMAAGLHACGADIALCSTSLMQTMSLAAMRLKGVMLQNARLFCEGRIVVSLVTREILHRTGAMSVDCEAALEESLFLPTVQVAVMLRENRDGSLKGSLRGKTAIDLCAVAESFGGGGHRHAAGFDLSDGTLEEVCEKILIKLEKELD